MTMNIKNSFDLDKVKFSDLELEMPYEDVAQNKENKIINKVQFYCSTDLKDIQYSVNSLAEAYEIIDCSIASRTNTVGAGEYSAMVIYKVK